MSDHDYGWRPYVSVATRRRRAAQTVAKLQRSGRVISPVTIEGRKIARTFWGESWCRNLEAYSDYVNRLPRGPRLCAQRLGHRSKDRTRASPGACQRLEHV